MAVSDHSIKKIRMKIKEILIKCWEFRRDIKSKPVGRRAGCVWRYSLRNNIFTSYFCRTKKQKNNTSLNYFDRIKIMSSVKPKMKRFFESRTVSGRTKTLTDVIRSYINDSSDYHVSKNASINTFLTFFRKILVQMLILLKLNKIPIFNPESKLKIIFNSIIVSYSCFYLFISSL